MGGDKPIGLVIAAVVTGMLVALPAAIPAAFYLLANVYAVTVGSDFSSDSINVGILLTVLVLTVAFFLVLAFAIAALVGRALSPKRGEA